MKSGIRTLMAGLILTCACTTVGAHDQDVTPAPTSGSVPLKAGFTPDPFTKDLVAWGPIPIDISEPNAFVANEPGFDLHYTPGDLGLTIYAESSASTTLLVQLPDKTLQSNDDWPAPSIRFEKPQKGHYRIWVGTRGKNPAKATLVITEIMHLVSLKAGFGPRPWTKDLLAGGRVPTNKDGVRGFIAAKPDIVLEYTAAKPWLTISAAVSADSKADTTLLVQLPDGKWKANDNGPDTGLNPLLRFKNPQSGRYKIWVGTVEVNTAKAKLMITEMDPPKEWSWRSKFPFDPKIANKDVKDIMPLSSFLGTSTLSLFGHPQLATLALAAVTPDVIVRLPPCKDKKDYVRGTPYEEYKIQFKKDRFYEIEMRADARMFFACLRLEDSAGRQVKSASSRDKADDVNTTARMTYFCKEAGAFTLIATNYSGAFGTFDIKVREDTPYIYMKDEDVFEGFSGELIRSDSKDSVLRKSPCKTFWFRFEKGSTYDIELAANFDTVLRLEDDAGQELAFNDDRPAGPDAAGIRYAHKGTDSRITFACKSDRTYRVIATSLNPYYHSSANGPVGYGKFDLIVAKVIRDTEFTTAHMEKFITDVMKTTISSKKETADRQVVFATPSAPFDVVYDGAAKTVTFKLDGYTAALEKADTWNRQEGKMARIVAAGGKANFVGTISFADANFADGISFAKLKEFYDRLLVETREFTVSLLPIFDVILADGNVKRGQFIRDDPKDPFDPAGTPVKVYAVTLTGGKTYQIDMTSTEVDSYLRIHDAAGRILDLDNNSGGDLNAKIVFDCPADGTYSIVATTVQGTKVQGTKVQGTKVQGGTYPVFGNYTLTVSQK